MKALLIALTLAAAPLHAGGIVLTEEAYEAEPAPRMTTGEKVALAAGLLLIIALVSGGGSNCYGDEPQPEPETGGC